MIKAIHFADYHLGHTAYSILDPGTKLSGRVLDYLDTLDSLVDYAVDNDADIVLFAGDAFHKHSPEPTLVREFGDRIVRLAEQCPVVILVGNHDVTGIVEKASAVDIFQTLRVPNVIVGYDYQVYDVETKNGTLQVATAPYPLRNKFLTIKEKNKANRNEILQRKFSKVLKELSDQIDRTVPAVLLGHFSVTSAQYGSERMDTVGEEAEVHIQDLATDAWDYVALGHLHLHQEIISVDYDYMPPIVYAGSLDRVDFSEEADVKGFVWIEFGDDGAEWEFVEVDARPFVTIDADVTGIKNQTKRIISKIERKDLSGAIVRVRVATEEGRAKTINRKALEDALQTAGAYYVHEISIKEDRPSRTRLDESVSMTAMTHEAMLITYFQTIGKTKEEIKSLVNIASGIMKEVNNV